MIKVSLTNGMLTRLLAIERAKERFGEVRVPIALSGRLRKSSKKRSSYASNQIEGNPLTEEQAGAAIESARRHYLKPEHEIRNYFAALEFLDYLLEKKIAAFAPVDLARVLKVSNRTVINWCAALVKNGFLVPDLSGQRIRSYSLTELAKL